MKVVNGNIVFVKTVVPILKETLEMSSGVFTG